MGVFSSFGRSPGTAPQNPAPDEELIREVLAGNPERYADLVQRYQERLYRHALGMVLDSDAAADLVQDAFVKAYSNLATCHDPARFGAWIFRILKNRCADYLKDRRRATVTLQEDTAILPERNSPESEYERTELRGSVGRALALLPATQREAFLLKHLEGYSYDEMAELLDASVSALKMRVLRAREALQTSLKGVESSGGGV